MEHDKYFITVHVFVQILSYTRQVLKSNTSQGLIKLSLNLVEPSVGMNLIL